MLFPTSPSPRSSRARLALTAAALLAASAAAAHPALAVSPSTKTVQTSRGEFPLLVFTPPDPSDRPLVLLTSGEGGWRRFDDQLADVLTGAGCFVGGIDVTKYFWEPQDDRQKLAADMRAYASALAVAAGRKADAPVILAGFSFGADLAPWVAGAGGWENRLAGMILIGPDETGSLQFRILEILGFQPKDHTFSVGEALDGVKGVKTAFIHGEKDDKSAAVRLAARATEPKKLLVAAGADHHFSGQEDRLKTLLKQALDWIATTGTHD